MISLDFHTQKINALLVPQNHQNNDFSITKQTVNDVLSGFYLNGHHSPSNPASKKPFVYHRSIRFGFLRRHIRSMKMRWTTNQRYRRNLFTGSPVAYILCVPC